MELNGPRKPTDKAAPLSKSIVKHNKKMNPEILTVLTAVLSYQSALRIRPSPGPVLVHRVGNRAIHPIKNCSCKTISDAPGNYFVGFEFTKILI